LIGDRLKRAVGQYNLTLRYWLPETLALALVHLFIAAETLTDIARDRSGMTDEDLAEKQKIAMKVGPLKNRQDLMRAAKNYARHKFIFHDDDTTHKRAADASDGFEHGFMDFEDIKAAADAVALPTAQHVRRAILEFTDFDQGARDVVLSEKFETPMNADEAQSTSGFLMGPATDSNLFVPAVNMSDISVVHASYMMSRRNCTQLQEVWTLPSYNPSTGRCVLTFDTKPDPLIAPLLPWGVGSVHQAKQASWCEGRKRLLG
jgi:hypothetical protein